MVDGMEKKKNFAGDEVCVVGPSYEKGKPVGEDAGRWSHVLGSREEVLSYLVNGERYFYNNEWYGSERRKNPA